MEWPNPEVREFKEIFNDGIAQIKLSEELGYDYVLIAEHHFSNYGFSPAPLLQALKIAENTESIKIGTAAIIVPEWQPCLLYTSPSPRDLSTSRMPSSA